MTGSSMGRGDDSHARMAVVVEIGCQRLPQVDHEFADMYDSKENKKHPSNVVHVAPVPRTSAFDLSRVFDQISHNSAARV